MSNKPRVLIIYTGGTIGMIEDSSSGKLSNVNFNHVYDHVPELKRLNIELDTLSFENPIDSSQINPSHWRDIANSIFENYSNYDGFVVLHGTDTMAYTASALSFMFDGLRKPVILTGSQLPIGILRTDGKENLITAIEIASIKDDKDEALIQEVVVYFDYSLFRGNRSSKVSADNFEAFRSPNYESMVEAGVELKFNKHLFYRTSSDKFTVKDKFNEKILLLKLFPGMNFERFENLISKDYYDGLIIESFGAGNVPSSELLSDILKRFTLDGGVILNITQCNSGKVDQGKYLASDVLSKANVISGGNMTTEAAVAKMMHVLGNFPLDEVKKLLASDVRGEVDF